MEGARAIASAASKLQTPQFLRPRPAADVPEDVDYILEHLNDPNYEIRRSSLSSASTADFELQSKPQRKGSLEFAKGSDYDSESHVGDRAGSRMSAIEFDDESPYPEVRASVSSIDDPLMPVNTFRMWFLGVFYTILISALNQFFSFRYPSVYLTGIVVQLTTLPLGKGLGAVLPTTRYNTFGYTWSLNPGPFSIKEHVVITVMGNVVVWGAYTTDVVASQRVFYGHTVTFSYQMLLALSTQLMGFGLAGILRQFLVWPSAMIWPGALVNAALFNTLHKNYNKQESKHISRHRFFYITVGLSFLWYWIPGFLWTGLSVFNWVCWIAPNNVAVNQLFGTLSGLGMGILTFDWSMISYIGSPLVTPWWSEANTVVALLVMFWFLTPILYFTNTWYAKFMPISAYLSFDNMGLPYDPKAIFTDGAFDVEKYRAYSPLFLSMTQAISIGISFAAFASVIVHAILWYRRDVVTRFSRRLHDERDVHSRLMQYYPEVPHWWFGMIGLVSLIMSIISIEIFPTGLPIWGLLLAISLSTLWALPTGMIQAITNQQIPLADIAQLIAGYILPNRPVANMIFKASGYMVAQQAIVFSGDLKLGHYMKIPPRIMFLAQVMATFISCFIVTLVQNWMFSNIQDFCTTGQKDGFSCPSTRTFATNSLIWGGIGPARLFSPGQLYSPLLWFFMLGALSPIPFYFLSYRYPLSFWRYINVPVFFSGIGAIPPASGINYSSWAITGFIFQYWMRRFHFRWWMRYNYILSAGLDAGVAISMLFVFFTVQLPKGGIILSWWGNNVWQNTADALGTPMYVLQPGETFGPPAGSWS